MVKSFITSSLNVNVNSLPVFTPHCRLTRPNLEFW